MRHRALAVIPLAATAAVLAVPVLRRYRPQQIPPGLADGVLALRHDGWTVCRWHSLRCRDRAPHVHVSSPGGMTFVLYESGRVTLPAALGLHGLAVR